MDRHFHISTHESGKCVVTGANDGLEYAHDLVTGEQNQQHWRRGVEVALQMFGATFSDAHIPADRV